MSTLEDYFAVSLKTNQAVPMHSLLALYPSKLELDLNSKTYPWVCTNALLRIYKIEKQDVLCLVSWFTIVLADNKKTA